MSLSPSDFALLKSLLLKAHSLSPSSPYLNAALDLLSPFPDDPVSIHLPSSPVRNPVVSYRSMLNEYAQRERVQLAIATVGHAGDYIVSIDDREYICPFVRKKDAVEEACKQHLAWLESQ